MTVHYDDKGKFFTPVVTKDPVPVIIQTLLHRIDGFIYIRPEDRISDTVNENEQFIALTDVSVANSQGKALHSSDFLLVNRDHIIWILPKEEKKAG
jgi:hypothetical protein